MTTNFFNKTFSKKKPKKINNNNVNVGGTNNVEIIRADFSVNVFLFNSFNK